MWVRGFNYVLFMASISHLAYSYSYPSFSSVPRVLTTIAVSASSAASSPTSSRFTNIADYRRKEEKAKQLQAEKQLIEDDELGEDSADKERNEANPSFLQKKINKILTKIQLFSSFVAPSEQPEIDENNSTKNASEETSKTEVKIDFQEPDFFKSRTPLQSLVSQQYGAPLKINLEIQDVENVTDSEDINNKNTTSEMNNKIGQAGIYFTELLGSFIGLIYGAFAHINRVINGETTPETKI